MQVHFKRLLFSTLFTLLMILTEAHADELVTDNFPMQMFEDKSANMSFTQIQQTQFKKTIKNSYSLGTSLTPIWLKFKLDNGSDKKLQRFIYMNENFIDKVDLYEVSGDETVRHYVHGLSSPFSKRQIKNVFPIFELQFLPHEKKYIYIKLESKFQHYAMIQVMSQKTISRYMNNKSLLIGIYFGALIALLFYNLFIYLTLKDKSYLLYICYVATFLTWQLQINGYIFSSISANFYYLTSFVIPLWVMFLTLFSRTILETKRYTPKIDNILKWFSFAYLLLAFTSFIDDLHTIEALNHLTSISLPLLLLAGILTLRKGNKVALFYLIAMGIFISTSTIYSLMVQQILDYTLLTRYSIVAGSVIEILLFSLALAYRINLLKQEKLVLEQDNNKELEKRVTQRTQELSEVNNQLKEMAYIDYLTKTYNRRYFNLLAENALCLSKRQSTPLSIAMIDIDKFKQINDTYGHDIGDEIIKKVASDIKIILRESDTLARFGGDEFMILLPDTGIDNAMLVAEKLRSRIKTQPTATAPAFTISIGVSERENNDSSLDMLLKKADSALYRSKQRGRDQVSRYCKNDSEQCENRNKVESIF